MEKTEGYAERGRRNEVVEESKVQGSPGPVLLAVDG